MWGMSAGYLAIIVLMVLAVVFYLIRHEWRAISDHAAEDGSWWAGNADSLLIDALRAAGLGSIQLSLISCTISALLAVWWRCRLST